MTEHRKEEGGVERTSLGVGVQSNGPCALLKGSRCHQAPANYCLRATWYLKYRFFKKEKKYFFKDMPNILCDLPRFYLLATSSLKKEEEKTLLRPNITHPRDGSEPWVSPCGSNSSWILEFMLCIFMELFLSEL